MLYYLTTLLYVLVCLVLMLVILLQQGKGGDIASAFGGGGGSQTAFGARSGATVLSRATAIGAVLFIVGALVLGILGQRGPGSVVGGRAQPERRPRQRPCPRRQHRSLRHRRHRHLRPRSQHRRPRRSGARIAARTRGPRIVRRGGPSGPPALPSPKLRPRQPRGSGGIGRRTSLRGWR